MNIKELESLGVYVNAGHADIYMDGKHHRLGSVARDGELIPSPGGSDLLERVMFPRVADVLLPATPDVVVRVPKDLIATPGNIAKSPAPKIVGSTPRAASLDRSLAG